MLVSLEVTSPEVYFRNSVSTLNLPGEGEVFSSTACWVLNRVGRDLRATSLAIGEGWTGGFKLVVAVALDIRLRYLRICARRH
jgi:hypothetical protein